jgi:hypothetical protein
LSGDIALNVLLELPTPKVHVPAGRGRTIASSVAVPEATLNENCPFASPVREIRSAGQARVQNTIPNAALRQAGTND